MARYSTTGTIQYFNNWVMCWVDDQIKEYYRSLLPKAWYVKPPRTKAHISVVRKFELPNKFWWGLYEGLEVKVEYDTEIKTDGQYYWLDAYCDKVISIRKGLELPDYIGNFNCQHITLGNTKEQI